MAGNEPVAQESGKPGPMIGWLAARLRKLREPRGAGASKGQLSGGDGSPEGRSPPRAAAEGTSEPTDLKELLRPAVEQRPLREGEAERVSPLAAHVRERFDRTLGELPAFPTLAQRIFGLVEHPTVDVNELVQVVGQDSLVSGQVLKLANSALLGRGSPVGSLRDAVIRLGHREVAAVAAAASTRALFDLEERTSQEAYAPLWDAAWRHSSVSAFGASWLAMRRGSSRSQHAFFGGMFHDVGRTAALRTLGGLVVGGQVGPVSAELAAVVCEELHVEVGVRVLAAWNLQSVEPLCRDHHRPTVERSAAREPVHVVRVVSALDELQGSAFLRPGLEGELLDSVEALGLDFFALRALATELLLLRQRTDALRA